MPFGLSIFADLMVAKLISALLGLTAIAELAFYAFKGRTERFILGPALGNVGRIDHFTDLQVVTLNGSSCPLPLRTIHEQGCYFNQTNIPKLFIFIARLLDVGEDSTTRVGFLLGALAIATVLLAYALCLRQWRLVCATALGLSLYPFRLALERGNIDLIILILLIFSALLATARPPSLLKTSLITILFLLANLGKLYPLLFTPLLMLNYRGIIRGRLSFLAILLPLGLAAACFLILLPDLHAMLKESYKDVAGGLSYGLATLVEPGLTGLSLLGLKLTLIAAIAYSSFSRLDVFGGQSLAARVSEALASSRAGERLSGVLFLLGSLLLLFTYVIFINGIYRIALPFLLILPAVLQAVRFAAATTPKGSSPQDLGPPGGEGSLFLLLILVSIGLAGYRPYLPDSNVQHYTNLFLNLVLLPTAIGVVGSALALVVLRGRGRGGARGAD